MKYDLRSNLGVVQSIVPQVLSSDTNGTAMDLQGYNSCLVAVHVGNSADTLNDTNTIELELEESDDNSTFTDVAAGDMSGEQGSSGGLWNTLDAAAEDQAVFTVGYTGAERYVRPVVNFSGTHSTGTPISAIIMGGDRDFVPVPIQQANRAG